MEPDRRAAVDVAEPIPQTEEAVQRGGSVTLEDIQEALKRILLEVTLQIDQVVGVCGIRTRLDGMEEACVTREPTWSDRAQLDPRVIALGDQSAFVTSGSWRSGTYET